MRLLSYNIHKGIGGHDRRYDLDRIIEVVEHENPDFINLQEVTHKFKRCRGDDQPTVLVERLRPTEAMYQTNVTWKHGSYGNLILARWPMRSRHQISLRQGTKKPRGAQIAVIETPEGLLKIVNLHLGLSEGERHWQMARLLDHRAFHEYDEVPTLIAGDFNDWRNTLAANSLTTHGFQHATAPPSRFRSFPAWFALGSLDKAFARGELTIREVRVVKSAATRRASDHLPLVVDFHLGSPVKSAGRPAEK